LWICSQDSRCHTFSDRFRHPPEETRLHRRCEESNQSEDTTDLQSQGESPADLQSPDISPAGLHSTNESPADLQSPEETTMTFLRFPSSCRKILSGIGREICKEPNLIFLFCLFHKFIITFIQYVHSHISIRRGLFPFSSLLVNSEGKTSLGCRAGI